MDASNSIFVQISSYRDPELKKTILDLIDKADKPDNIRICVGWQHGPEEDIMDLLGKVKNLRIIDQDFRESKGVCEIRSRVQQNYRGEAYTLCLDSHHRFVDGWDTKCIEMHRSLKERGYKPLLTAYLPSYDPDNDPKGRVLQPWRLRFDRFTPEGCVFFLPEEIPAWRELKEPVRSRFFSGHFTFTEGPWNENVPYDPNYYFHGEEISLAVRSFTHGYDLFHPHEVIAWHEYTRKGRTKQWDDDSEWHKRNQRSHARNRQLLRMDPGTIEFGRYGLGKERSLKDYEVYSGVNFRVRGVQEETLSGDYPPNLLTYNNRKEWTASFRRIFRHCIDLHIGTIPEGPYDFWVFEYQKGGKGIFREDISEEGVKQLFEEAKRNKDQFLKIWKTMEIISDRPDAAVIWAHSKDGGWGERVVIDIKD